jgi:hypothetical protein
VRNCLELQVVFAPPLFPANVVKPLSIIPTSKLILSRVASKQAVLVKIVGAYVVFGYCVMEILFFAVWCRPFHNYWSVPAANPQCSTYHDHLIVNTIFNISSDVLMLCIPLPMLIRAQLPLQKKLILCVVFSMGIFVIISAVLSKYYSFSLPYGVDWVRPFQSPPPPSLERIADFCWKVYWYVREVSTAVIVANMPHLWALVRRTFNLRAFLSHSSALRSRLSTTSSPATLPRAGSTQIANDRKWVGLKSKGRNPDSFLNQSESEEQKSGVPLEIRKDVKFRVERDIATRGLDADPEYTSAYGLDASGLYTGWQSNTTLGSSTSAT